MHVTTGFMAMCAEHRNGRNRVQGAEEGPGTRSEQYLCILVSPQSTHFQTLRALFRDCDPQMSHTGGAGVGVRQGQKHGWWQR